MPLDKNESVLAQFHRLRAELHRAELQQASPPAGGLPADGLSAGAAASQQQPISDEALATLVAADQIVAALNQFHVWRWRPWRKTQPSTPRGKD